MAALLEESLAAGAAELGIGISDQDMALYRKYYQLLQEENSKYNLTSLEGEREVAVKHFLDSLCCAGVLDFNHKLVVDIGTGAGFPGVPLKINCRDMVLVLVDSVKKKVGFLDLLIEKLDLADVKTRWDRAETMGRAEEFRERADIVVSRAVASLNVLAEICLPLVKLGGWFLSLKGPGAKEELAGALRAVDLMGGGLERVENLILPIFNEERNLILIRKVAHTPEKYPRREGMPAKRPIV
ncbi:MAG: 16S rRNA (guanine(527)-N(7))-methyltransferase RsmG [Actinobacteria bacterium]|nr:16S rRNA (guanine(527)-N(7))-methyltransferase RsmG [Actinomycetota bacterium]